MEASFWHQKWEANDTPFHGSEANALLVKYFNALSLAESSRVFIPLCGKTLDILWLLSNGYRVAGAELSKLAIEQLFAALGVEPIITTLGAIERYSAGKHRTSLSAISSISSQTTLGPVDAIYDPAALVALPETMRNRYTAHLSEITDNAPQLLICYEYDQSVLDGPPFSISNEEVHHHYRERYTLTAMASTEVPGGLKGKCAATENVWLLKQQSSKLGQPPISVA